MSFQIKANKAKSSLVLIYFLASIGIIGSVMVYAVQIPLHILGRVFPPAKRFADQRMKFAVKVLMATQPWFNGDFNFETLKPFEGTQRGVLLISNHRSHLDVFCFLLNIAGVRVLAKRSLLFVPLLGFALWATRHITAKRGDIASFLRSMEKVRGLLREGDKVAIFPEMTRCPKGLQGTQDFVLAPFWVAMQEKVQVIPIVVQGTDAVWPKGTMGIISNETIRIRSLAPLDPTQFANAEALRAETRRLINEALVSA